MSPYVKDSPTTIAQKAPPTSESASAAAMALDGPVRPLSHGVPWRDAKEPVVPYGESSVHVSCALPEVELGLVWALQVQNDRIPKIGMPVRKNDI